ncbi:cupredoxin family copper-binding protein [Candidatus Gottesmanbacteria bacterium]|nr:cupredoxin family copper-binding protein [Candidatus Gottesmanbacteria bacterium]
MQKSASTESTIEQSNSQIEDSTITIANFAFSPQTITFKKGSTVTWTNEDNVGHTVTSDTGTQLNSPLLSKGQSYSKTFNETGTFSYHCTPHPNMKGTVIVE